MLRKISGEVVEGCEGVGGGEAEDVEGLDARVVHVDFGGVEEVVCWVDGG